MSVGLNPVVGTLQGVKVVFLFDGVLQGVEVPEGLSLGVKVVFDGASQGVKVPEGLPQGDKVAKGIPLGVKVVLSSIASFAVYSRLLVGTNLSKNFLHSCCKWINRFGMLDNSDGSK